ncbi:MAG: sodium-dependent transporter, partial [Adlercreutzia sp.]
LVVLGLPIMVMEFAVGRGSQRSIARAFNVLEPAGTHWHKYKWVGIAGCYLLMMFYTTVAGWMLAYVPKFASGQFVGADSQATSAVFDAMLASPVECVFWMVVVCVVSILICSLGVQKGVERITKAMMLALLAILGVLVVRALTLPGAADGVAFYLLPDFSKIFGSPDMFFEAAYAAMGQAFFTLSIGMGSMTIFGSYIDKHRSLMGEAATIGVLDTGVALATGLIIFPACFAFGVAPDSGPGLVFITLPSVFEQIGRTGVGHAILRVHVVRGAFHGHRRVRGHSEVLDGPMGMVAQAGRHGEPHCHPAAVAALCARVQRAFGCGHAGSGRHPDGGGLPCVQQHHALGLAGLRAVLRVPARLGLEELPCRANGGGDSSLQWLRPWMRFGVPVLVVIILIMGWVPIVSSGCEQSDWCLRRQVFVRLGIAGFGYSCADDKLLKKWSQSRVLGFMGRSLRSWRQLLRKTSSEGLGKCPSSRLTLNLKPRSRFCDQNNERIVRAAVWGTRCRKL